MTLQGISTPIAVTRYTIGERGVVLADQQAESTAELDQEIERMRKIGQQVAEFAARRTRELRQRQ